MESALWSGVFGRGVFPASAGAGCVPSRGFLPRPAQARACHPSLRPLLLSPPHPRRGAPGNRTPPPVCRYRFSSLLLTLYIFVQTVAVSLVFFLPPLTAGPVLSTLPDDHLPSVNETALLTPLTNNFASCSAAALRQWFLPGYLIIPRCFYAVLLKDNYSIFLYIHFFLFFIKYLALCVSFLKKY